MNKPSRGGPPASVPTLTEVIDLAAPHGGREATPPESRYSGPERRTLPIYIGPERRAPLEEAQLTQRVLNDLQRQVDQMLEYRIRETLAPVLQRAADAVVRDARLDLASTLRELVARAVAEEMSRHRAG